MNPMRDNIKVIDNIEEQIQSWNKNILKGSKTTVGNKPLEMKELKEQIKDKKLKYG